jgi:lysylphosphatidylglycerol synthetase-like protein (DUF2156 family)
MIRPLPFVLLMVVAGGCIAAVLSYLAHAMGMRGDAFMFASLIACLICTAPAMWVHSELSR